MHEPIIQWAGIAMFASAAIGYLAIHGLMRWQDCRRRRLARGFRNMKSIAHVQRSRARQVRWGDTAGPARRNTGSR